VAVQASTGKKMRAVAAQTENKDILFAMLLKVNLIV
jgi:hypothetical protein